MKSWLLLAVLLLTQTVQAQKNNTRSFSEKLETAQWMREYDSVAWRMSELVTEATYEELARIGREWFCYKGTDSLWNGVYGKFKDGKYDQVLHYRLNTNDTIDVVPDSIDAVMLVAVSKAINVAYREAGVILGRSYVKMNKFIQYHQDKTITIWLMPALQPSDVAMYGGEFYYHFDESGTKVLEREEYYKGHFKGFKIGKTREVRLNYEDADEPTQGAIYFALQYQRSFSEIHIDTRGSTSLLAFSREKGYYWRHADKSLAHNP